MNAAAWVIIVVSTEWSFVALCAVVVHYSNRKPDDGRRLRNGNEPSLPSRIGSLSVDEANPYVKILVYGRNGAGKTRFAATGPSVVMLDVNEEGTRSAKGTGAKKFQVETWADIGDVSWYLKAGNHSYESVAIDTVTALNRLVLKMVMGEAEDRDPNRELSTPDRRVTDEPAR